MHNQLEEFRTTFLQEVYNIAESIENFYESTFIELFAKELLEAGEFDEELELCHWSETGIKIDGYSYNDDEGVLTLVISIFSQDSENKNLNQTEVNQAFKRLETFFLKSFEKNYFNKLEESTSVYDLAYLIYKNRSDITSVKYYILSNKILNDKIEPVEMKILDTVSMSYYMWDIARLFRMNTSSQKKEAIFINFKELGLDALYCLPAHLNTNEYQSYLLVMPGTILATLYGKYGARLLEHNVRTFLQARGKVNIGMKNTIISQPEKFFAYNNGLTTTAEEIELEETNKGLQLKSLKNLQIVNGGQTTASIYSTMKKAKKGEVVDLSKIFVQMKLTIVAPEKVEALVPKISEYANTQNKVNATDFFSNHPFHIRMEEFSRRIYAPTIDGSHRQCKWFYERARGQYLDAQTYKTDAEKNKFHSEYPKNKLFTKTDLSKYENVWNNIPYVVAQGAQNSFVAYATAIGKLWEKDEKNYNELYYKSAIAKAIIFNTTESLISHASWYIRDYRAQAVAYSIAYMSHRVQQEKKYFDFLSVWSRQKISRATEDTLNIITEKIYNALTNPPSGITNIGQWAKRESCWKILQELEIDIPETFFDELLDKQDIDIDKKEAKKLQRIDNGIEAQKLVFKMAEQGKWLHVKLFAVENKILSQHEIDLLDIACAIPKKYPSEKQAIEIVRAYNNLLEIGLMI